jgi:hypothetical protein
VAIQRAPKIYVVADREYATARLVRAVSKPAAVAFVAAERFGCELATQDHLVAALSDGVKVEDASPPDALQALIGTAEAATERAEG